MSRNNNVISEPHKIHSYICCQTHHISTEKPRIVENEFGKWLRVEIFSHVTIIDHFYGC